MKVAPRARDNLMGTAVNTANVQQPATQSAARDGLRAKMLIAAALALVVCRLIGAWQSIAGMAAAGLVMAALAIALVSVSPRLRRFVFCLTLPLASAANAGALAIGSCLALMGSQGLLPGGRLGMKVPWTPLFWCVPLSAGISLFALAKTSGPGFRSRRGAALAGNLVITLFATWYWTIHGSQSDPNGAPPLGAVLLLALTAITLAAIVWEVPRQNAGLTPNRQRAFWRIAFIAALAVPIATTIVVAFLPLYRHRRTVVELESLGFDWMPGPVPRWARNLDDSLPVYGYLAEVEAMGLRHAQPTTAADAERVEDLLRRLPALSSLSINVPPGAERIVHPLTGRRWIRGLMLIGPGTTNQTLTDIATLPGITHLSISHSSITDTGLAELAKLTNLEEVDLSSTEISGKGLSNLSSLPRLWALDLSDVEIGDSDLKAIERYPALRMINLRGTHVTDEGIAKLRQALPLLADVNVTLGPWMPGVAPAMPPPAGAAPVASPASATPASAESHDEPLSSGDAASRQSDASPN